MNFELVDIEYVKEGKDYFLRIFIDKEGGVDFNDCIIVLEKISEVMDENDLIFEMYYFDVVLLGVERLIKKEKDFYNVIN